MKEKLSLCGIFLWKLKLSGYRSVTQADIVVQLQIESDISFRPIFHLESKLKIQRNLLDTLREYDLFHLCCQSLHADC